MVQSRGLLFDGFGLKHSIIMLLVLFIEISKYSYGTLSLNDQQFGDFDNPLDRRTM